jgi:hypothetical protein
MKNHPSIYQRSTYYRKAKYQKRGEGKDLSFVPDFSYLLMTRIQGEREHSQEYSPRKKKWFQLEWGNKRGIEGETSFMNCVGAKRRHLRHLKECKVLARDRKKMKEEMESAGDDTDQAKERKLRKWEYEKDIPFYKHLAKTTKVEFDTHNKGLKLFTGHELSDMPCAKKYVK